MSDRAPSSALIPILLAIALPSIADERPELGEVEEIEIQGARLEGWNEPEAARIGAEDLRMLDRRDVAEAVSLLPGVSVQNLGARSERLVFVRGFNSRQVPLFIDGVPVYVPYDGNVDLSRFLTYDVAEISVTKGLTSTLYGANTLGGSINLVSRRPTEALEAEAGADVEFDSGFEESRYSVYANAGTNQGIWYTQGGFSYADRDFFRLGQEFDPTVEEDGARRENSASRDYKFSLKLGFTPNEQDEYALSYANQQGEKQTPPYAGTNAGVRPRFWRWPEWDKQSVYFISRTHFAAAEFVKVRIYYDQFDNTLKSFDDNTYSAQTRPFAFTSVYDDYTVGGSMELGTDRFDRHAPRFAVHYKRDVHRETDNTGLPEEHYEDEILSIGIDERFEATERLALLGGLSYDQQRGIRAENVVTVVGVPTLQSLPTGVADAVNVRAGAIWEALDVARLHLSVARRSRFPTIKDRYSFRLGSALPNPDLRQEQGVLVEFGADGGIGPAEYGVNLFYSRLEDAIESVSLPPTACTVPPCFQLQNIGEQRNQGVELLVSFALGEIASLHANYTFLDRDNLSSPLVKPIDVPEHEAFMQLRIDPVDRVTLIGSLDYGSRRLSSTTGDRVAGSFVTGNLELRYRPIEGIELELGVRNLADRLYAYEEGFWEAGRTFRFGVRFTR